MERIPIRLCTNRPSPGLRGVSAGAVKKFFHSIVCLSNGLIIGSYGSYIDGDIVCTDGLYAIDLQRSGRAIQIAGFPAIAMHPNILHPTNLVLSVNEEEVFVADKYAIRAVPLCSASIEEDLRFAVESTASPTMAATSLSSAAGASSWSSSAAAAAEYVGSEDHE